MAGVSPAVTIRASNEPSDGPSFQALVSPAVTMQVPGCPLTVASLAAVLALAPAPATQARSSLASPLKVDIMTLTPVLGLRNMSSEYLTSVVHLLSARRCPTPPGSPRRCSACSASSSSRTAPAPPPAPPTATGEENQCSPHFSC